MGASGALRIDIARSRGVFIGRNDAQCGRQRAAGEALWRFSLALYARPGVADALIALQDRAGRDVNLILFALWLGATRARRLDPAELAAAEAAIAPLNAGVVHPLRRLRRELKAAADRDIQALRRRILQAELARRAAGAKSPGGSGDQPPAATRGRPPLAAAEANLALYLGDEPRRVGRGGCSARKPLPR